MTATAPLTGGYSSRMLALTHADGRTTVLRQLHADPWRRHAVELLTREAGVQRMLAGSDVVAPTPLAVDPDGAEVGDPSLLMTRLPGGIDLRRPPWSTDDDLYLEAFARLAAPPPAYAPTFLHRDFQPGNVLWQGGEVAGVVDWVDQDVRVYWRLLDLVGFLPAGGRESGATQDTIRATWRAHGRDDLTLELARRHRENLLRLTLSG